MVKSTDEIPEDSKNPPQYTKPTDEQTQVDSLQEPEVGTLQTSNTDDSDLINPMSDEDLLQQMAGIFLLWWNWAYFEIKITQPHFQSIDPPIMIQPEMSDSSEESEFVYAICDHGYKLSTSKASEMFSAGMSMCKLFYTIEKMIFILIERIKASGVDEKTEVQVAFDGHLLAQRKAFESIINLNYNVVVTNFDPSTWGERYLEIVKRLADKGYGYPPEAPRDSYKLAKIQSLAAAKK